MSELLEEFKRDYLNSHRTTASECTFADYFKILKWLPMDEPISVQALDRLVQHWGTETRMRQRAAVILGMLAKFAGLEWDAKRWRGTYGAASVKRRELPTDEQIVDYYSLIANPDWQWCYGMMAAFGLRSHELWHLDLANYTGCELRVLEQTKTGSRLVFPYPREWLELFNLHDVKLPQLRVRNNSEYGNRVAEYFRRHTPIPFTPYALRHSYCVRLIGYDVPVALAAKLAGHSVQTHTQTYHRHLTEKSIRDLYNSFSNSPLR